MFGCWLICWWVLKEAPLTINESLAFLKKIFSTNRTGFPRQEDLNDQTTHPTVLQKSLWPRSCATSRAKPLRSVLVMWWVLVLRWCFGPPSKCPAWHMEWPVGQCRNQVEHSATSTPRTGGWRLGWCYCASWTGWCGISRSCISCQEWKTRWSELHQPLVKFRKFLSSMELRSFSLDEVLFLPVSWSANWCFTSSSSFTSGWGRWPAEGEGHGSGTGRVDITEALEVSGGIWR